MEFKIWNHLIQILSYRIDLIETIKTFMENLNNRNINDEHYILERYTNLVDNQKEPSQSSNMNRIVEGIIEGDKLEALQELKKVLIQ